MFDNLHSAVRLTARGSMGFLVVIGIVVVVVVVIVAVKVVDKSTDVGKVVLLTTAAEFVVNVVADN